MCGIAGILSASDRSEELEAAVHRMLRAQQHRGPDDSGLHVTAADDAAIAVGSRRLAIIDVSPLGHQPMVNPDTGDVLVYNGELYNFRDLRIELERAGFTFKGNSDTEVLLRAYERWGISCVDRLKGMFAFAVWDPRDRTLRIARDQLGIKPLYWTAVSGRFIFASELRALFACGMVPFDIAPDAVSGYLAFGSVQEPLTMAAGVRMLPRGSIAEITSGQPDPTLHRYWRPPAPSINSSEEIVTTGRGLLESAVRRHLVSDVPLGVFLSSGIDSTIVLGLATRVADKRVHAFTVAFADDPDVDEAPIARATARRLGAEYHEISLSGDTVLQWVLEGLGSMDQPSMDGMNTYIVARALRDAGMTVALSGLGGDELFGGYDTFRRLPRWLRALRTTRPIPSGLRRALAGAAARRSGTITRMKAQDVAGIQPRIVDAYLHMRRVMPDQLMHQLIGAENRWGDESPNRDSDQLVVGDDVVATIQRLESRFYLLNTLLRDSDVFGMANSIEIRVPLLDRDVAEWALSLPGETLTPAGEPPKHLLRTICADLLSSDQTGRAKRGFRIPLDRWMLGPLRDLVDASLAHLEHVGVEASGVAEVRQIFQREPRSAAWSRLWTLVALGFWMSNVAPRLQRTPDTG